MEANRGRSQHALAEGQQLLASYSMAAEQRGMAVNASLILPQPPSVCLRNILWAP